MLDITQTPAPLSDETAAKRTQRLLIEDGRAAYRAGRPMASCPFFKDSDMTIDWMNGWRWESEGQ